jgi:hypothetical protein
MHDTFTAIEYTRKRAKAIIEYKHKNWTRRVDANIEVQADLADRAQLPFFVVIYDPDLCLFGVIPGNALARRFVPEDQVVMNETGYIDLQYRLRREVT